MSDVGIFSEVSHIIKYIKKTLGNCRNGNLLHKWWNFLQGLIVQRIVTIACMIFWITHYLYIGVCTCKPNDILHSSWGAGYPAPFLDGR